MTLDLLFNAIGTVTSVIIGLFVASRIAKAAPSIDADERLVFSPAIGPSLYFGVIGVFAVFIAPLIGRADQRVEYLMAGLGVLLCILSLPGLLGRWDVTMTEHGIEGPCRIRLQLWPAARTFIRWNEMVRIGGTAFTFEYVEAVDGRRVYWGQHLKGTDHLRQVVVTAVTALDRWE